jgi:O-succinylbenzoic acid--CoA ligase
VEPWLERAAALWPDVVALDAIDGSLTYAQLLARARAVRISAPRVALALPPGLDFAVALHACLLRGATAVPIDLREPAWRLAGAGQVIEALENGGQVRGVAGSAARSPRAAAASRAVAGSAAAAASRPGLASPALVVHTSGTTGVPSEVSLSLGNILHNTLACAAVLGLSRSERWLCPLPLHHVGGLMVLLRSVIYGTTAVIGSADRSDISVASLVPTQLARLVHAPPPSSLRVVLLGGAPADPSLLLRAREAGWPVAPSYGLTQACSAVTIAEPGDTKTSGRALPGLSVSLADDGEILVSGPSVAGGGVLRTGDLGRFDDHGRLIVRGRKVDTIVSGGENVMPTEVEAVLLSHPAVVEAGVFGRPDREWGEAVTAFFVGSADPAELRAFARERLAPFKVPKTIEKVESLPRGSSGKLLRRELR